MKWAPVQSSSTCEQGQSKPGADFNKTQHTLNGPPDAPEFDVSVPSDGYAWWYVDGISADHSRAISIIAFIGSVFSPWYRWAGRRAPHNHVCMNVATYGPGGRFAMTERGQGALGQTKAALTIGPSRMAWADGRLVIEVDEHGAPPWFGRLQGQITLTPHALTGTRIALTPDGSHQWRPFAPDARIDVDLGADGWRWTGHGYFDANFGNHALEADFDRWTWGRYPTATGTTCFYDAELRDGSHSQTAIAFDRQGRATPLDPPPMARLPRSLWQVARTTRADAGARPRQVLNMLDAPFYSRAMVQTQLDGQPSIGVHEALDLRRFRQAWLMPMLACRVPRFAKTYPLPTTARQG